MYYIGYIKFTNLFISQSLPQQILKLNNHYALVLKNKLFVLSTTPSKYLISETGINKKMLKSQYLWEQCYQFDTRIIQFIRVRHADIYLVDHFNKFQKVIQELDFQNVIDLTKFIS